MIFYYVGYYGVFFVGFVCVIIYGSGRWVGWVGRYFIEESEDVLVFFKEFGDGEVVTFDVF